MTTAGTFTPQEWAGFSRARATVEWGKLAPISQAAMLNAIEARRVSFQPEEQEKGICPICDMLSKDTICANCLRDRAEQGQADIVVLRAEIDHLHKVMHDEHNVTSRLTLNVTALLIGMDNKEPQDPDLIADLRTCVGYPAPEKK